MVFETTFGKTPVKGKQNCYMASGKMAPIPNARFGRLLLQFIPKHLRDRPRRISRLIFTCEGF
ncbi:MAG: hypothetical protein EBY35_10685 [Rhodobacteraceae bacterium]|nr:hypothetical protein [Paracoccaceae bacterium]